MKLLAINTEQAVIEHIQSSGFMFVHRYNPKHETLRRIAARMLKEAKLKMTRRTSTGCEYQTHEAN